MTFIDFLVGLGIWIVIILIAYVFYYFIWGIKAKKEKNNDM